MPTVLLSHFFVALDQASYDALRSSPEIAALAAVAEKHTVAGAREWAGFYISGRQTYMEFFGPRGLPDGLQMGGSGLALTVEEPGGVAVIADALRGVFGKKVEVEATASTSASGDIPWFTATYVKGDDPEAMITWVMEIDPGFLAATYPGSRIEHPLGREQYQSWNFLPDRPLDDVVGVTAALNPPEMFQLAVILELLGWMVQRGAGGFVAQGPDVKLTVVPASSRSGVQQVDLRLRHPVPNRKVPLGSAELLLDGNTGRLVFWI